MSDNTQLNPGSGGLVYRSEDVAGVQLAVVKIHTGAANADGGPVTSTNPVYVQLAPATTGTQTSVAASATDVTVLAANTARKGCAVANDSTATLYLLVGTGTSSTTVYTVALGPGAYWEQPINYTGILKGIWSSATGSARVTEWT